DVTRAIAGLIEQASGSVALDGKPIPLGSVRQAFANEVIFVPEDRASEGVFLSLQVARNLVATRLPEYARAGFVASKVLRRAAEALAGRVGVVHTRLRAKARELSGGNQQKVVFARAVERQKTGVLLMNEPTRGIDVGARADIYKLMRGLCAAGYSLVMTSSDLEEVVGMADIVFTMYRGRMVARYEDDDIAMATILRDIAHPPTQRDAA
ncbi:MAG: ATP-binding cassette domain-containing protein, partial [Pseudolabrys sp.]